jgi:moderate conductance mechanosensitive channel
VTASGAYSSGAPSASPCCIQVPAVVIADDRFRRDDLALVLFEREIDDADVVEAYGGPAEAPQRWLSVRRLRLTEIAHGRAVTPSHQRAQLAPSPMGELRPSAAALRGGAGFSERGLVGDPDAELRTRPYGQDMIGVSAVVLHAHPGLASSGGFDAEIRFLVDKPLAILGILVGAFVVNKLARRLVKLLVRRLGRRRVQRGPGLVKRHTPASLRETGEMLSTRASQRVEALAGATSFVVWVVAALAVLHVLGVRLGPLLTGAGLIGVALGFGAQSLIRDFLSGVFIPVEHQFGVGDWVDFGAATGSVEAVTLRATRIRSVDGTVWHVPNGQIQRAGNMSQHWSRALLDVQIALDSDIDRAREAIKRVADEIWHEDRAIIEEPEAWGVQSLGHGGITIRLVAKPKRTTGLEPATFGLGSPA